MFPHSSRDAEMLEKYSCACRHDLVVSVLGDKAGAVLPDESRRSEWEAGKMGSGIWRSERSLQNQRPVPNILLCVDAPDEFLSMVTKM